MFLLYKAENLSTMPVTPPCLHVRFAQCGSYVPWHWHAALQKSQSQSFLTQADKRHPC